MSNCCSNQSAEKPGRQYCPASGQACLPVATSTIMHHLKTPWLTSLKQQAWFFCDAPDCEVVYFGEDGSVIKTSALRTEVGVKQQTGEATLCYCYGVSRQVAMNSAEAKAFVIEQTKNGSCACETRNPSGRCCLKDFPKE